MAIVGRRPLAGTKLTERYLRDRGMATMDLSIPPELEELKSLVRMFVSRELAPLEQGVDEQDHIDPVKMHELRQRAVEIGIYGYNLPTDVGGGGVSALGDVLISEEMGRTSVALSEAIGRL